MIYAEIACFVEMIIIGAMTRYRVPIVLQNRQSTPNRGASNAGWTLSVRNPDLGGHATELYRIWGDMTGPWWDIHDVPLYH